jgi:hypothetical protein
MNIKTALQEFGISELTSAETQELIAEMQSQQTSPSDYLDCVATGAYKEVYFISDKVALKFALDSNETMSREAYIYNEIPNNLLHFFAKSSFIPLDTTIPSTYLYDEDNDDAYIYDSSYVTNPDYNGSDFDCIVIQEKIARVETNTTFIDYEKWDYYNNPLYDEDGDILDYKEAQDLREIIVYQEWIQAAINLYGKEAIFELNNFCEEYGLYDLHSCNIGFRNDGSPIIFDFLS